MKPYFTSIKQDYETPKTLFQELDRQYRFTLDVASSKENAKCSNYYTEKEDGLKQSWQGHRVWCNPPYNQVSVWIEKAYQEASKGALVVCLVPSRTDAEWFHEYAMKGRIVFIKGRITFEGASNPAPFPSCLVIFQNL